jgi:twitching motility two-component system response regulator PilH
VIVDVDAGPNFQGEIHVAAGQVSHAATANLTGLEALREILSWSDARVSERKVLVGLHGEALRGWIGLVLELVRSREPLKAPVPIAPEIAPAPRPKTGKKIVVIDDTEMLLVFVEDVLTLADPELQITTAHTGGDGLKKIQEVVPDLVLIDYSLPDMNGDKVCRRLLQDERTAAIPVLMMSGHGPEMMAAAKRLPNVVAAIEKPFFSKQLVDLVGRTLAAPRPRPLGTLHVATDAVGESRIPLAATPPPKQPVAVPPRQLPAKVPLRTADTTAAKPHAPAPPPRQVQALSTGRTPQRDVPTIKPPPPPILQPPRVSPKPAEVRVATAAATETVLSLYLEVVSMQVTPQFEMRSIRARPAPGAVALRLASGATNLGVARETGFRLGPAQLDVNGRILTMRLVPNSKPFQPAQIRTAFQIGSVAVVPGATRQRVQLTTAGSTPMMLQIVARPELAGVKLSSTFQVGELVLKWRTNMVRVTLDPKAPEESGAMFELSAVQLDNAGRLVELLLNPAK